MLVLYYVPRTRSSRARWMLEETGFPYELVRIDPKNKPTGYEQLHPLGHVPVLKDGEYALFESAAICLHLADKEPRLAPPLGTGERAHYYQWMFFGMTEVEPLVTFLSAQVRKPEVERDHAQLERTRGSLVAALQALAAGLADKEYFLAQFSALDIVVGAVLIWANSLDLLADQPKLKAYVERLKARPAYLRATVD